MTEDDFDYEEGIKNIKRFFKELKNRTPEEKEGFCQLLKDSYSPFDKLPKMEDLCSPVITIPVRMSKNEG